MVNKGRVKPAGFWTTKKMMWLGMAIIVVAGLIFYSNSFKGSFVFDDLDTIMHNKTVVLMDDYGSISFWTDINKRPLSFFTFALNYQAHHYDTFGYHLINFLIHVLGAVFTYFLARLIFRQMDEDPEWNFKNIHYKSLFVALLFLLHPIQTMGVTYVVQRMTSLAAMFYLLAVFLYLKGRIIYAKEKGGTQAIWLIAGGILSGILAVLSKQNAVTFPLAFLFADLFFVRNKEGQPFKKYLGIAFSVMIIGFLTVMAFGIVPAETSDISRTSYLLTQSKVILRYLQLLFLPIGQNIDHNIAVSEGIGMIELVGMLVVAGLIFLAVLLYKKYRIISFGIVWFLLALSVESSIIPIRDVIMEHRLYLPMFGFSLVIVDILYRLLKDTAKVYATGILVVIMVILGIMTYQRNELWKSPRALWEDSLSKNPANARGMVNLGAAFIQERDYSNALKYYNNAIKADTTMGMAYLNRGIALFDLGKYKFAVKDLSKAIAKEPKMEVSYFFRGVSYGHLKQYDKGIQDLTKVIKINPGFPEVYKNRGVLFELTHNYPEALDDFNEAIKRNPNNKKLLVNRSKAYFMMRKFSEALKEIKEAEKYGIEVDYNYIRNIEERIARGEDTMQYYIIRDANGEALEFEEED